MKEWENWKSFLTSSLNGRDAQQDGKMLNAHMLFFNRLKGTSADIWSFLNHAGYDYKSVLIQGVTEAGTKVIKCSMLDIDVTSIRSSIRLSTKILAEPSLKCDCANYTKQTHAQMIHCEGMHGSRILAEADMFFCVVVRIAWLHQNRI